jgi:hypothetical protein
VHHRKVCFVLNYSNEIIYVNDTALKWRNCRPYVLVHALEPVSEPDEEGKVDIKVRLMFHQR